MISEIQSYTEGFFSLENRKAALEKTRKVAKHIFIGLTGIGLYLINPSIFIFGFHAGIVWHKKSNEAIERICNVWRKYPWEMGAGAFVCGLLSLPASLAAASLLYSMHLGSTLATLASEDD